MALLKLSFQAWTPRRSVFLVGFVQGARARRATAKAFGLVGLERRSTYMFGSSFPPGCRYRYQNNAIENIEVKGCHKTLPRSNLV